MSYFIYGVLILVVVCCIYRSCNKKPTEKFTNQNICLQEPVIKHVPPKMKKDLSRCTTYTRLYSRPNKCFSCEKDILRNAGPKYINFAFPGKCFSCERQSKQPYNEGPTKCFSCE